MNKKAQEKGVSAANDSASNYIMLIDNRVENYQTFLDASLDNVICVVFDFDNDSIADIIDKLPFV